MTRKAVSVRRLAGSAALMTMLGLDPSAAAAQTNDSLWLASRGFFQRRGEALLHHDRAGLAAQRSRSFSRVLGMVPGMEAVRTAEGAIAFRFATTDSTGSATQCVPTIYLNGNRMELRHAARELSLDQLIRVTDVTGLEVFDAAHAPVGGVDVCAAVLVWDHRRSHMQDPEFTGVLRGRALDGDGNAVAGIAVVIEPGGSRRITDDAGRFDFGSIVPGRYQLTATAPDGGSWSSDVQLRAFSAFDMTLVVERESTAGGGVQ